MTTSTTKTSSASFDFAVLSLERKSRFPGVQLETERDRYIHILGTNPHFKDLEVPWDIKIEDNNLALYINGRKYQPTN